MKFADSLPLANDETQPSRKTLGFGALGGTRTPNLLIRSQMLYPLSYKRLGAMGNLVSLAQ